MKFRDVVTPTDFHLWLNEHVENTEKLNDILDAYRELITKASGNLSACDMLELSPLEGEAGGQQYCGFAHENFREEANRVTLVIFMENNKITSCRIVVKSADKRPIIH